MMTAAQERLLGNSTPPELVIQHLSLSSPFEGGGGGCQQSSRLVVKIRTLGQFQTLKPLPWGNLKMSKLPPTMLFKSWGKEEARLLIQIVF